MLRLPIYNSVSIDITWGEEKSRDINDGYENEYYTETSDDFRKLIEFITSSTTIYGKCPNCNRYTYFNVGFGCKLSKNLSSGIIRQYRDSQMDAECYILEVDKAMDSLCRELTSFSKALFFDKHFSCPECNKIYKASFTLDYKKDENKIILTKIGQYPQMWLISPGDNKDYDKILEKFHAKEDYKKAIQYLN